MSFSRLGATFLAVSAFLCLCSQSEAQQVFGTITGVVTDPSGGAVIAAKVSIVDIDKNVKYDVTTNEAGNFTKGQLIQGNYRVEITAPGFSRAVSPSITVNTDQTSRFDVTLTVGDVTQQVEVTAIAPLLQTDKADVAQIYTAKDVADLPNFGRNAQAFELLNPGTSKMGWQHAPSEDPQAGVQIQVNGNFFAGTGFELDGTTDQDPILGIIVINPNIDSLSEVKQANQDYDSEFSYTGAGLVTYTTKSGTNQLHGSAFEYIYLNTPGFTDFGRNPFSEPNGAPAIKWNQFGGSVGGRIIKDKLFFFGDAQLTRKRLSGSALTSVPTDAARRGDFSGYINNGNNLIYDPASGNPDGTGRIQFPNNTIPSGRISPQAAALLSYFPEPNYVLDPATPYRNNYAANGSGKQDGNQWDTRWDYVINEKNSFFGRYSYAGFAVQAPGAFGAIAGGASLSNVGFAGNSDVLNQSGSAGWTDTIRPTLVNEFRFGYMRYHVNDVPNGVGTSPAKNAGIPGLNLDNFYTSGMPYFNITGDASTALGYALGINSCNCPLTELEQQYQFVDNVTKIVGNHTFKFGADIRYAMNLRVPSDSHRAGELTFAPGHTGYVATSGAGVQQGLGLASFLLGEATGFSRYVSSSTNAQEHQRRWFWYGQDTWHPTGKLTINYGLRWEMVFPEQVNAAGNGGQLDLRTGLINVFGEGNVGVHGIQNMKWDNFAPRVGVAYQITKKTVFRAGYGWSYNLGTWGSIFGHNVTQNLPVLAIQQLNAPNGFSGVFTLRDGPSAPTFPTVNADGTFPLPVGVVGKVRPLTLVMPVVYSYNGTVERQITAKIAVAGSYVGNAARHAFLGNSQLINVNQPAFIPGLTNTNLARPFYSKYGWTQDIQLYCDCSNGDYNSFQSTVKVQGWAGYTAQGSYTYQVAKSDGFGFDGNWSFLYNRKLGWGNQDWIPHNQITLAQSYDLPVGRGQKFGSGMNKGLNYLVGGWQASAVMTIYSGLPFNPSIGSAPAGAIRPYIGPSAMPNMGSGDPYAVPGGQSRKQWIVGGLGGAFLLPADNTYGTYPINSLYGPKFVNFDMSLSKTVTFAERFHFTLRVDSQNAFNHTNLGIPNNNITDTNVGQITSLASNYTMRKFQFSGRLTF